MLADRRRQVSSGGTRGEAWVEVTAHRIDRVLFVGELVTYTIYINR